jgi:hypothetical protein
VVPAAAVAEEVAMVGIVIQWAGQRGVQVFAADALHYAIAIAGVKQKNLATKEGSGLE